jgi:hypothetical protein
MPSSPVTAIDQIDAARGHQNQRAASSALALASSHDAREPYTAVGDGRSESIESDEMTVATDHRPPPATQAPAEASQHADPARSQLGAWVHEDHASVVVSCDAVFGGAITTVTAGAIVCAVIGQTSATTAGLLLAYLLVNLVMSKAVRYLRRIHTECIRTALIAPLTVANYVLSDGLLQGMWLPFLIQVAGSSMTFTVLTRNAKYGYAIALWNMCLLATSAAISEGLDAASALWQCTALFVVGFVLANIVRKFGETATEARIKRHEAETHKRNLECSLRQLDEANRGMRLVLDSVAQGFITIDLDGVMASERSAVVEQWFGEPAPGATFRAFMARHDPVLAAWFALGLESIRDDFLPLELCLEQMPKRLGAGARTFDINYSRLASCLSSATSPRTWSRSAPSASSARR